MTQQNDEQLATIPTEDAGAETPASYGSGDLDLVRIYNKDLDAYGETPRAGLKFLPGWELVEPSPEEASKITNYDPSVYTAKEVTDHLAEVEPAERDAILALEKEGKNRATVVNWTPPAES